jgi:hypothetical protein
VKFDRPPERRERRTSPAKHAPRARRTPFVLLILGLMVGGMCLLLALNTASAANEVARHDLAANDQSAAAQLVQLENQVQASAAPANLAAAAAALGMVPAGNPGFLEIDKSGRVRVLGSASAATALPVVIPHPAPTKTPAKHAKKKADKSKTAKDTKKNKKKNAKTAKPSTTKTSSKTATPSKSATPTKSAAPKPTPTPTPETTLPGGNR